jgi:ribosomal protein L31
MATHTSDVNLQLDSIVVKLGKLSDKKNKKLSIFLCELSQFERNNGIHFINIENNEKIIQNKIAKNNYFIEKEDIPIIATLINTHYLYTEFIKLSEKKSRIEKFTKKFNGFLELKGVQEKEKLQLFFNNFSLNNFANYKLNNIKKDDNEFVTDLIKRLNNIKPDLSKYISLNDTNYQSNIPNNELDDEQNAQTFELFQYL